jgi:hypothetical protein
MPDAQEAGQEVPMTKQTRTRLSVHRETLVRLGSDQLKKVGGGRDTGNTQPPRDAGSYFVECEGVATN